MQITTNLGLKKPEQDDPYNIQDMSDNMDIIDEKVQECFQSVSNGKRAVASAITGMGVSTSEDATFQTMADNIASIQTGPDTSGDTIVASVLLEGYTAHDKNGIAINGAMADYTNTTDYSATPSIDNTNSRVKLRVPNDGKFSIANYLYTPFSSLAKIIGLTASKIVKCNTILGITGNSSNMDTSEADATAENIFSGKKAGVNGELITGSMTDNGAVSKTLNTSTTSYTVPKGYHNGSGKVSITTQTKTATPTASDQTISPDSGKVLSGVTVKGVSVTAPAASNILTGSKVEVKSNGTALKSVSGSMPNIGAVDTAKSVTNGGDGYIYARMSNGAHITNATSGYPELKIKESDLTSDGNGVAKIYYLGTGTRFDIKTLFPNEYANLTANNFIVGAGGISGSGDCLTLYYDGLRCSTEGGGSYSKQYDPSTGIFTCSGNWCRLKSNTYDNWQVRYYTASMSTGAVYLVIGDIETV